MFVMTLISTVMMLMLIFSGCNAMQLPATYKNVPADEPVQFVGVADEDVAPAEDSERLARESAELERIRLEGQASRGLVRNAPDYNR